MAKKYNGGGSKSILSNAQGSFANLPTEFMMKSAGYNDGGQVNSIGDEYSNIEKQISGDNAKARSDFKLRKA